MCIHTHHYAGTRTNAPCAEVDHWWDASGPPGTQSTGSFSSGKEPREAGKPEGSVVSSFISVKTAIIQNSCMFAAVVIVEVSSNLFSKLTNCQTV